MRRVLLLFQKVDAARAIAWLGIRLVFNFFEALKRPASFRFQFGLVLRWSKCQKNSRPGALGPRRDRSKPLAACGGLREMHIEHPV